MFSRLKKIIYVYHQLSETPTVEMGWLCIYTTWITTPSQISNYMDGDLLRAKETLPRHSESNIERLSDRRSTLVQKKTKQVSHTLRQIASQSIRKCEARKSSSAKTDSSSHPLSSLSLSCPHSSRLFRQGVA